MVVVTKLLIITSVLFLTGCFRSNEGLQNRLSLLSSSSVRFSILCSEIGDLHKLDATQQQKLMQIEELEIHGQYLGAKFPCAIFPNLKKLVFYTDEGRSRLISELRNCTNTISCVSFVDTVIDEESLKALSKNDSLLRIEFGDCGIDAKTLLSGLMHFKDSTVLRNIRFSYCGGVSSSDIEDVRKMLPTVQVDSVFY